MSGEHLIDRYVARTASKLPFGRQMRKRIAAEITDYLVESTDAYEETGLSRREAERRAVEAFRPPYVVARSFAESRGVRAMATRFTRWAGLAAIVGALLVGLSITVQAASSWTTTWTDGVGGIGGALMGVGLVGLHMRQRGTYGAIGRCGFRLIVAGFVATVASALTWFTPGWVVAMVVVAVGIIMIGAASYRADVLPRLAVAALSVGGALAIGLNALHEVIMATEAANSAVNLTASAGIAALAAGWLWLGSFLWSETASEPGVTTETA